MRLLLKFRIISAYGNQAKFAESCGKSDNWISRIIQARQEPTDEEKILIRQKLGVDPNEPLFEDLNV
jgi:transcriptional regulator with XRE-family HTH domain